MEIKRIDHLDIKGKRILVRVDFNVPIDSSGKIISDKRIKEIIPTIEFIAKNNPAYMGIISHLDPWKEIPAHTKDERLRLNSIAKVLEKTLGLEVKKLDDCVDIELPQSGIFVLENLRFHKEEKKNDDEFAQKLAKNFDIFVNDAFGTMHREHASIVGIPRYIESCIGFLVERELYMLNLALGEVKRPYVAIIGGVKVDKLKALPGIVKRADKVLLGGAIALTILKQIGYDIGKSKVIEGFDEIVNQVCISEKVEIPIDFSKMVQVEKCDSDDEIDVLDIGDETIEKYISELKSAKTIVWSGALGKFEDSNYEIGTRRIAEFIATLNAIKIIGGGDTASAIERFSLEKKMTHISTGGSSSLLYLSGEKLPGLEVLRK